MALPGGSRPVSRAAALLGIFASPQDAIDAYEADPHFFGNRFAGLASAVERKDLIRLCPCRWSASAIFPLAMSFRDPFFLPFEHYLPLEFGNRAKDRQHHFSGRARRVKIHVQDAEPNVLGLQRVDDPDQIPHTPRQSVKLANNKRVAFAAKICN